MEPKVIITCAVTGAETTRAHNPALPITPLEIADDARVAREAGAAILHLHVRDDVGAPTQSIDIFRDTMDRIRKRCDIVVEGSTGGVNELSPAERSVSLRADIEMASLNPGSVNYDKGVYINSPDDIAYWVQEMHRRRIKPDIAIFEAGMVANSVRLAEQGWIEPPFLFAFVLGQPGAMPATPKNLLLLS